MKVVLPKAEKITVTIASELLFFVHSIVAKTLSIRYRLSPCLLLRNDSILNVVW